MAMGNFDFSGYVTKYNLKCADDRTILNDAFKEMDGKTVPMVWQHGHHDPENVLGHILLESRDDGVYGYAKCNYTDKGKIAKQLVHHKDITTFSIFANGLVEKNRNVIHGVIREVSLVMAGANPGAKIDNIVVVHGDGSLYESEDEVIIHTGLDIEVPEPEVKPPEVKEPEVIAVPENKELVIEASAINQPEQKEPELKETENIELANKDLVHADAAASDEETVEDVFNTLSEKQKTVVYAIIAQAVDAAQEELAQSNIDEGDDEVMKYNVFENSREGGNLRHEVSLSDEQFNSIVSDAMQKGSFRKSFLEHVATYGIDNIDYLFPDPQAIANTPAMLSRRMEWVSGVINGVNHSPFSRIKTLAADITADDARARGYVKAGLKKDEIIRMLKRVTTPKTIYKKQKLDRDDVIDITDLDVVAWMKAEMRVMLDEELARAILVSDGRAADNEDKIDEDHIRPVWKDDDMYAHHIRVASDGTTDDKMDAIIRGRENYMGSGSPVLYTTMGFVSDMLLLKDSTGRRIYQTVQELENVLRVSKIVEVPVMTGLTRESDDEVPVTLNLVGIVVNLKDYTLGADKGGQMSMFDDFDIDYNQFKYLLETRCSGALTLPKSALVIEQIAPVVG